jgi:hypothetical protein
LFAYRKFVGTALEDRITRPLRQLGFRPMRFPNNDLPTADKVLAALDRALDAFHSRG